MEGIINVEFMYEKLKERNCLCDLGYVRSPIVNYIPPGLKSKNIENT